MHGRCHGLDYAYVAAYDLLSRLLWIDRDVVHVQLKRVCARDLEALRERRPLFRSGAVDARDDGHNDLSAYGAKKLDVALRSKAHRKVGAEVVEGDGRADVAEVVVYAGDFGAYLLLERAAHHDGPDAGLLQFAGGCYGAREGR